MNKYTYLKVIQKDYGFGFEDLTAYEVNSQGSGSRKEILNDLKAYRENEGGFFRVIFRREKNNAN